MATPTTKAGTKTVYRTLKPQRLQIDGKVSWYPIGSEIDPKWIHPVQLQRMVKFKFLEEVQVPIPPDPTPAPSPSTTTKGATRPLPPVVAAEKE